MAGVWRAGNLVDREFKRMRVTLKFVRCDFVGFSLGLLGLDLFQNVSMAPDGGNNGFSCEKNGGSGGARTRNLCRDRAAL